METHAALREDGGFLFWEEVKFGPVFLRWLFTHVIVAGAKRKV
jgi:hypothetical protein